MRQLFLERKEGILFLVEEEDGKRIEKKLNLNKNFKIKITGKEYLTILNLFKKIRGQNE